MNFGLYFDMVCVVGEAPFSLYSLFFPYALHGFAINAVDFLSLGRY